MSVKKIPRFGDRQAEVAKESGPKRVQQARKTGPHGTQIDAQGDNNAAPKKHRVARIG